MSKADSSRGGAVARALRFSGDGGVWPLSWVWISTTCLRGHDFGWVARPLIAREFAEFRRQAVENVGLRFCW